MDSMPNLPLFPHQIYNNGHQQQLNNLLSWVTSLPQSGNHHHHVRRIYFSILEQWRRLDDELDNNVHQQQPNLLSSEDGVTSSPQSGNHHHQQQRFYQNQLFYTIIQLLRRQLDTDNIPYEQLLELHERIGNVNSGLSEESITNCLKTRTVTSGDVMDEKIFNETCIVCQDKYKDNDTIGALECGHEYHRECIKEWLLLKNLCPICKRPALWTTN